MEKPEFKKVVIDSREDYEPHVKIAERVRPARTIGRSRPHTAGYPSAVSRERIVGYRSVSEASETKPRSKREHLTPEADRQALINLFKDTGNFIRRHAQKAAVIGVVALLALGVKERFIDQDIHPRKDRIERLAERNRFVINNADTESPKLYIIAKNGSSLYGFGRMLFEEEDDVREFVQDVQHLRSLEGKNPSVIQPTERVEIPLVYAEEILPIVESIQNSVE